MPKPNTKFDLSVADMELIEAALRKSRARDQDETRRIQDLLGRLHNQKNFFRPKGVYVSG